MRILHTSDWHLGRTLYNNSRIKEQEDFTREIKEIAREEKVDLIIIAGDVYDFVNPPAEAEELFYNAVSEMSEKGERAVVAIAGNHDNPDRLRASFPLAYQQGIFLLGRPGEKILTPDFQPQNIEFRGSGKGWFRLGLKRPGQEVSLIAMPFPSEARLQEALVQSVSQEEVLRESYENRLQALLEESLVGCRPETVNLFTGHLFIRGSAVSDSERPLHLGGALTLSREFISAHFDYAALGHLHRPQQVHGGGCPARYSGSPLAYSFSEADQTQQVVIIEINPGEKPDIREIPLKSGRPLIQKTVKTGVSEAMSWLEKEAPSQAWIDLEIHLEKSMEMSQIQSMRKIHSGLLGIRPVFPDHQEVEKQLEREGLPLDELFRKFYRQQKNGAEPQEELVDLFLELGREAEQDGEGADL